MTVAGSRPLLSLRGVSVHFTRFGQSVDALRDVVFDVVQGEWVLIVGPNGAGKSTLLKAAAGALRPNAGSVTILGRNPATLRPHRLAQSVFLVHQDPLLGSAPLLTIFENLFAAEYGTERRTNTAQRMARYVALLSPVGLDDRLHQPVKLLSGGERQLLALIIAQLRPASLILLDEPLAALDPGKASLGADLIAKLRAEGKTIVQVAHDTRLLTARATRMVTIVQGVIVTDEPIDAARTIIGA